MVEMEITTAMEELEVLPEVPEGVQAIETT